MGKNKKSKPEAKKSKKKSKKPVARAREDRGRNSRDESPSLEVKHQHSMSRREAHAALEALADDLLALCPFSVSPDEVSDALSDLAHSVRRVAVDLVTRLESRGRAVAADEEAGS